MPNPQSGWNGWFADKSSKKEDVLAEVINDLNELKLFKEFALQDPNTLEKYEQYKTFVILKNK